MRALVTGGGGFLGGAIARRLKDRGDYVRVFGRSRQNDLEALGVDSAQGDLADREAVCDAVAGCDVVFHAGAKVGLWGDPAEFERTNVEGTKNVIAACLKAGIAKLVFTGSPSVVFTGGDIAGADESAPYPDHFDSDYSRTKADAEKIILAANHDRLATVSLRPHLIWGPGDRHLFPRIVARARSRRLFRIGKYNPQISALYIDDAVEAHLHAAVALSPLSDIAGKAYFLASDRPIPIWGMIDQMLAAANLPASRASIPYSAAMMAARACEAFWRLARLRGEPPLTVFLVRQLTTAHWFDVSAAHRDLDWSAKVDISEGMRRLAQWHRADARLSERAR